MLTLIASLSLWEQGLLAVGALVALAVGVVASGAWVIDENQSGLVIKKFGPPLQEGALIALHGEAGYQARMLSPGFHFGLWRWRYRVVRVPMLEVPAGQIALVLANDGAPIPTQ